MQIVTTGGYGEPCEEMLQAEQRYMGMREGEGATAMELLGSESTENSGMAAKLRCPEAF